MNADPGKAQDSLHVGKQERLVRSIPRLPGVSVRTSENGYKYHQVPAFHGFFNRVMSHVPRYLGVVQVDHIYIYMTRMTQMTDLHRSEAEGSCFNRKSLASGSMCIFPGAEIPFIV